MAKKASAEDVRQVLAQVKQPTIDRTPIDLGILKDSKINNGKEA